ncbi:MAG: flagellar FlbD family protein [Lachnospiraceae bacterium]
MIEVTKLNGVKTLINAELIETVEETPDTVISFVTGKKIIVKESRQEIKNLVILYTKNVCLLALPGCNRGKEKDSWMG